MMTGIDIVEVESSRKKGTMHAATRNRSSGRPHGQ
jgi:hypothetical protein